MRLLNTVERKVLEDGTLGLPVKTFTIDILKSEPMFMVDLGLASAEPVPETVQIQGYSLKDAKKRAGIQ
jgi:hypothetical protein